MLHLVLAVISLWDVAPTPLATAASHLTSRLESAGLSSEPFAGRERSATFGGPTAAGVCTFGSPPLTSHLYDDAAALYRAFSTPECADERPLMPLDFTKSWLPSVTSVTPVRLEPALLRPPFSAGISQPGTSHLSAAPAPWFFAPAPASRGSLPTVRAPLPAVRVSLPAMRAPSAPLLRR
jgi:hypothetical protein